MAPQIHFDLFFFLPLPKYDSFSEISMMLGWTMSCDSKYDMKLVDVILGALDDCHSQVEMEVEWSQANANLDDQMRSVTVFEKGIACALCWQLICTFFREVAINRNQPLMSLFPGYVIDSFSPVQTSDLPSMVDAGCHKAWSGVWEITLKALVVGEGSWRPSSSLWCWSL